MRHTSGGLPPESQLRATSAAGQAAACMHVVLQVLFKLDRGGWGEEVQAERLSSARELPLQGFSTDMFLQAGGRVAVAGCAEDGVPARARQMSWGAHLRTWSRLAALQMCVMAGCDFLPNLPGLGIKKANALLRKHRDFVKVRGCQVGPACSELRQPDAHHA